jgi:hypothetical protein
MASPGAMMAVWHLPRGGAYRNSPTRAAGFTNRDAGKTVPNEERENADTIEVR